METIIAPKKNSITTMEKNRNEKQASAQNNLENVCFFKAGKTIHKIDLTSIDYVLAYGNYSKLYMASKQLVVGMPLKDIEEKLSEESFVRIHRSCIVSIRKIEKIYENTVYMNNINLAIGKQFRNLFYEKIFNLS